MIEANENYPIAGADLHWLIRTVEDAHRVPIDTEAMRYPGYAPLPSQDAALWREHERRRNTVQGPPPTKLPVDRLLLVGAVAVLIALLWGRL